MLTKPDKSGRVAKWEIELGEQDIEFRKRSSTEKKLPKDFLVEMPSEEDKKEAAGKTNTKLESTKLNNMWKLYIDGASSFDGSGAGLMIINPKGKKYTYALRFEFKTTNNEAEYEALLAGVTNSARNGNRKSGNLYRFPANGFDSYTIEHIRRNQNKKADALSKLASMTFEHLTKEVLVEVLEKRSKDDRRVYKSKLKKGKIG
ncbi:reverse transcriptase domain-containing protein [Tanacetum coccineum]